MGTILNDIMDGGSKIAQTNDGRERAWSVLGGGGTGNWPRRQRRWY